jgi:hypothetical protein
VTAGGSPLGQHIEIPLTPAQRRWASWALDAMVDYWVHGGGADEPLSALPMAIRRTHLDLDLTDASAVDVVHDLLYRLEEQAPALVAQEPTVRSSTVVPALCLATKVRSAVAGTHQREVDAQALRRQLVDEVVCGEAQHVGRPAVRALARSMGMSEEALLTDIYEHAERVLESA